MPLVPSKYKGPPFFYVNGHLETIVPSLRRKIKGIAYEREQIETPDDDFLNIDWIKNGNPKVLVISHGLEGGSDRHYVMGLAKLFSQNGWDIAAWNNRTCNGEMNRQRIMYHHAATYDLRAVMDRVVANGYQEIAVAGISMGGGQTLRYLGQEDEYGLPEQLKRAVIISAPCSLIESAKTLNWKSNRVYEKRFLNKLKKKVAAKAEQFSDIDINGLDAMTTLREFDDTYSGPLHGFKDAKAFYQFCDPYPFIPKIKKEFLVLNALNDPLLQGNCYPYELAQQMPNMTLETPERGGHVGFARSFKEFTYSEIRALEYLNQP